MVKEEKLGAFTYRLTEIWPNSLFLSTMLSTYEPGKCQNPDDCHLIYPLFQQKTKLGDYYNNKYNDMPQWKFLSNVIISSLFTDS